LAPIGTPDFRELLFPVFTLCGTRSTRDRKGVRDWRRSLSVGGFAASFGTDETQTRPKLQNTAALFLENIFISRVLLQGSCCIDTQGS
jgi:hypothetical protein